MELHNDHRYIQEIFFEQIKQLSKHDCVPLTTPKLLADSPMADFDTGDGSTGLTHLFPSIGSAIGTLPWPPGHLQMLLADCGVDYI